MSMKILLGCMHTRDLRNKLTANGHDVLTCDFKRAEHYGKHYQGDVCDLLEEYFDFAFFFPSCQYLSKAQLHRCKHDPERAAKRDAALQFVIKLSRAPIHKIAIENPFGHLTKAWRQPTQVVYPHQFGDPYRKEICLWLKNVPPLISTLHNPIRKSIENHVNGRMSQEQKSEVKSSWNWFPGMNQAIADQWCPAEKVSQDPFLNMSLDKSTIRQ